MDDQESECRAECERRGWPVRKVFCDKDIGASRFSGKERPAWDELKDFIRPGDIVVMWEASRSNRDLAEFVALRALCSELNVPLSYGGRVLDMDEAEDRFIGGLDALLAEREAETIRARVLRGKRSSAASGRPYGPAPWGLRRADTVEVRWELDPVEAPRIQTAMERALRGESMRSILAWLTSTGYGPTNVYALRKMLCNPALAGRRVHHRFTTGSTQTTEAQWPGIVTLEQQQQLMALSQGQSEPRGQDPLHLLTGIALCAVCRKGVGHKRIGGIRGIYKCEDGHVSRDAVMVDGLVIARLVEGFGDENPPADHADAQDARKQIEAIELQLLDYEEQAISGDVSASAFARIESGLLKRIEELRPRTLQVIPSPFEYMKISTETFFAATVLDRRAMVRSRLNVVIEPVGRGKKPIPEAIVISRK